MAGGFIHRSGNACFIVYKAAISAEYNQLFNLFLVCETAAEDLGERGKYLLHCWIVRATAYASSRPVDLPRYSLSLCAPRVTCRLSVTSPVDSFPAPFPVASPPPEPFVCCCFVNATSK